MPYHIYCAGRFETKPMPNLLPRMYNHVHSLSLRRSMDTATIIEELEAERDRLSAAITALQGRKRGPGRPAQSKGGAKRHLSPAARKRISDAMKKRWAVRKRAA